MTGNRGVLAPSWLHLPIPETAAPRAAAPVPGCGFTSTARSQGWWAPCRDQNQSGAEAWAFLEPTWELTRVSGGDRAGVSECWA